MNDKGVWRTPPATPGLSNMSIQLYIVKLHEYYCLDPHILQWLKTTPNPAVRLKEYLPSLEELHVHGSPLTVVSGMLTSA